MSQVVSYVYPMQSYFVYSPTSAIIQSRPSKSEFMAIIVPGLITNHGNHGTIRTIIPLQTCLAHLHATSILCQSHQMQMQRNPSPRQCYHSAKSNLILTIYRVVLRFNIPANVLSFQRNLKYWTLADCPSYRLLLRNLCWYRTIFP